MIATFLVNSHLSVWFIYLYDIGDKPVVMCWLHLSAHGWATGFQGQWC